MNVSRVIDYIVAWLNSYCDSNKRNGFVVGVSGGIDSAVTSTLCAMTGKTTMVISMPFYQMPVQKGLAYIHMDWLKASHDKVDIEHINLKPFMEVFDKVLPNDMQDELVMANTLSRIRMVLLYAKACSNYLVVAGTGNKVEDFGVGFYTKYGDGGVDISPIADLMKTEVYKVAQKLGISKDIILAPPSDGLWGDNRTDESQLGASYEELEWAMIYNYGREDTLSARQKEVLEIYRKKHAQNSHKIYPIPVCCIPHEIKGDSQNDNN